LAQEFRSFVRFIVVPIGWDPNDEDCFGEFAGNRGFWFES